MPTGDVAFMIRPLPSSLWIMSVRIWLTKYDKIWKVWGRFFKGFWQINRRCRILRADLNSTIFLACNKLTTGLRHDLQLLQRFKTCFQMLRHFSDKHANRTSCRRPVVSLLHVTKIVQCKSGLTDPYPRDRIIIISSPGGGN